MAPILLPSCGRRSATGWFTRPIRAACAADRCSQWSPGTLYGRFRRQLVFLTPNDARVAGIKKDELQFDQLVQTANGPVRAASVLLREIRIGDLSIEKVQAAVIDSQGQSVLGMSFLSRLKGFEMRGRVLTIDW